jgi:hypothetical protein
MFKQYEPIKYKFRTNWKWTHEAYNFMVHSICKFNNNISMAMEKQITYGS